MKTNAIRGAALAALCVALTGCTANPARHRSADVKACTAAPLAFSYDAQVLDMLRVYTGQDGVSHAERMPMPAQNTTYLGAVLRQFQLGDPSNVVIVSGPPNFRIPKHPSPYREFFLILAGSSVIELSDGTEEALNPGSMVFFEDVTGPGHSGRFGPCGYVAVDLQFKNVPAAGR